MINILYTVILFNILLVLFKLFKRYNIDNIQALTVNYFTATIMSYVFVNDKEEINYNNIIQQEWIYYMIILGVLFIIIFYLFAYSAQKIGLATTTIANKISVIIPVCMALILYPDEEITLIKIVAFIMIIIGLYLCTLNEDIYINKKFLTVILCVFFGQGILDSVFNHVIQTYSIGIDFYFFMILFAIATQVGIILIIIKIIMNLITLKLKNIWWGILFGIINLYSMMFFVKALNEINSAVVFSLVSIGIVITSSLLGFLVFKEKINKNNWIGIFISSIAIYILT